MIAGQFTISRRRFYERVQLPASAAVILRMTAALDAQRQREADRWADDGGRIP